MSLLRILLCIILPPLGVMDKDFGVVLMVLLLTMIGWVPGVVAALMINLSD